MTCDVTCGGCTALVATAAQAITGFLLGADLSPMGPSFSVVDFEVEYQKLPALEKMLEDCGLARAHNHLRVAQGKLRVRDGVGHEPGERRTYF